jgi:RHS repeat-associated protein
MAMPGRQLTPSSGSYRYGFNGMEKDDELKGSGNSYDFGARMYDPRLGRWLAVDLLASTYAPLSPFCFVANSPLVLVDPDGNRIIPVDKESEQVLMAAMVDQFGDDNPFKIKNGELKIRWFKMLKIKSQGGVMAELAIGMKSAIKNPQTLYFAANENGEYTFTTTKVVDTGYSTKEKMYMGDGKAKTIEEPVFKELEFSLKVQDKEQEVSTSERALSANYIPVAGDEPIKVKAKIIGVGINLSKARVGQFQAEKGGLTNPCVSCVIFHEIIDHFDFETRNNNGNLYSDAKPDPRSKKDQTLYHSKALNNKGSKGRDPITDH